MVGGGGGIRMDGGGVGLGGGLYGVCGVGVLVVVVLGCCR